MLPAQLIDDVLALRRAAPEKLWLQILDALSVAQAQDSKQAVLQRIPSPVNSDLRFILGRSLDSVGDVGGWQGLVLVFEAVAASFDRGAAEDQIQLIWTGPEVEGIPVRRIDQVLYDLVNRAKERILLVTFAAAKIQHLRKALEAAIARGIEPTLILEFEEESQGQLSHDAIRAFGDSVLRRSAIYYWPLEKRERNAKGRPGKLHAKCAVIDDSALIASANLTDDAFNRNIEVGVLIESGPVASQLRAVLSALIASSSLERYDPSRR